MKIMKYIILITLLICIMIPNSTKASDDDIYHIYIPDSITFNEQDATATFEYKTDRELLITMNGLDEDWYNDDNSTKLESSLTLKGNKGNERKCTISIPNKYIEKAIINDKEMYTLVLDKGSSSLPIEFHIEDEVKFTEEFTGIISFTVEQIR